MSFDDMSAWRESASKWKRQPSPVEAFLAEWKDSAPRPIFQHATEKISPDDRARFRRSKDNE